MKILLATPLFPPDIGGPATHAEIVAREFPEHGISVQVLPFSRVRHLPKIIRHLSYFFLVLWHGLRVEVLYALDPVSVGLPVSIASKILGKRFVVRIPGDYAWEQGVQRFGITDTLDTFILYTPEKWQVRVLQRIQSFVTRTAETVIVPSQYLSGVVERWNDVKHWNKIKVVYSSVKTIAYPAKSDARATLGIHGKYMLSAGRLVPWKGFPVLLDAFETLSKKYPDLTLGIAGDGPLRKDLEAQIKGKDLVGKVILLGNLSHDVLMTHISAADVFVLNTGYEGLSHQLVEVMQIGTPIVTTNVPGNLELVEQKVTGLIVPYNDRTAIEEVLEHFFADPSEVDGLVERAHARATSFTDERMIDALIPIFKK